MGDKVAMLSQTIQTPTGFRPNLQLGVDYTVTRSGLAKPLTAEALALFEGIQRDVSRAANLFGLPGGITVDGVIGDVTGSAVKFTIAKFTDDLRSDVSAGARDGDPAAIAKDARNVLGVLQEAIARKKSAPVDEIFNVVQKKFVLPSQTATTVQATVKEEEKPFVLAPLPKPGADLPPGLQPVAFKTGERDKKIGTLGIVGVVGGVLLLGTIWVVASRRS
jgi:hypothetical protein